MPERKTAVASFIINKDGELLIIKRRNNDPHKPGVWEIPGGRVEKGEKLTDCLVRETKEETNIDIDILFPFGLHEFTRDDGQDINLIIFLCRPKTTDVKLSEEHTDYEWLDLDGDISKLFPAFYKDIEAYKKYFRKISKK